MNEAWVSYLNLGMLIGTVAVALFNASKDNIARYMAYAYAFISVAVLVRFIISGTRRFANPSHNVRYTATSSTSIVSP